MSGPPGSLVPVRSHGEIWKTCVQLDVGSNGDMTVKYGKGIVSVADTATGKYTVTFTADAGVKLLDMAVRFHQAADEESIVARMTVDSFDNTTNPAAPTAKFEVWEIDETAAQVEPASGADCFIECTWLKTI